MSVASLPVTQDDASHLEPGIGGVTQTGWTPPDGITFQQWEAIGRQLHRFAVSALWWLGDWWRYGEHTYGERAAQAISTGYELNTIQTAAWVADRIPPSSRRETLSWSHHQAVAALPPDQQEVVLDQAEGNNWSRGEVRTEVRRIRSGGSQAGPDATETPDTQLSLDECEHLKSKAQEALRQRSDVVLAPGTLLMLVNEVLRRRG